MTLQANPIADVIRTAREQVLERGERLTQLAEHNGTKSFVSALATRRQSRALVLVESIYSVLGDAAPLAELARICTAYDVVLVVDEAHALGVGGPRGAGLLAENGLTDRIDVIGTGTLSKSLGSQVGFVAAHPLVREQLINRARPFIRSPRPAAVVGKG